MSDSDSDIPDNTRRYPKRKVKDIKVNVNIFQKVAMPGDRWTLNEKRKLYNALCKYGITNLKKITEEIGTRKIHDVEKKMFYYEKKAHLKLVDNLIVGDSYELVRNCDLWIKRLRSLKNPKPGRCSALEIALKIIELYEEHPDPKDSFGIDFQKAYGWLYDCCSGHPVRKLNAPTSAFMLKLIDSVMEDIDKIACSISLPGIISSIRLKLKEGLEKENEVESEKGASSLKDYEKLKKKEAGKMIIEEKTDQEDVAIFKLLLQDPDMNPLNLQAHLLKEN